jgi:site-specific DNA-methyltransferase (adenine-specific)
MVSWDKIENLKEFTNKWFTEIKRIIKNNTSIYIFWSQKYIPLAYEIFNPNRMLIWWHPNLAKPTTKMFLWTYDPIFYIKFGKPIFKASFVGSENVDVIKENKPQSNWFGENKRYHPTSKSPKLLKRFVRISSNQSDTILDPFMGSGTTGVACKELNRNFIGIEIEPKYYEIAKKRIENTETNMFVDYRQKGLFNGIH